MASPITFIKANVASLVASACDFAFAILLREFFKVDDVVASVAGTVLGGIINFTICRYWAFDAAGRAMGGQVKRYFITWGGNLILNALGVYLLINHAGIDYRIAKLITSLTVAFAYNYPLQKKYVFKNIQ
jgi:putative flippase GtrA